MKHGRAALAFILAALMFAMTGCVMVSGSASEERVLSAVRQSYRSASLVVFGTCIRNRVDENGEKCSDVMVTRVIAGEAQAGAVLHCDEKLTDGASYLLCFEEKEEAFYSEDGDEYKVVSDGLFQVKDNQVVCDGLRVSLTDVEQEFQNVDDVVSAHAQTYYYNSLLALFESADEVFVGKVNNSPSTSDVLFRSEEGGSTAEYTICASMASVTVYGSIRGKLKYGDLISMVYAPRLAAGMLDAATLESAGLSETDVPAIQQDGYCLFFLLDGPDQKQNYYFPINPVQGFAVLSGDDLHWANANKAAEGCLTLTDFVNQMRASE